jgi:pimeloyl-ACP methyl ester carboxylesterase
VLALQPALVIWGGNDRILDPDFARRFEEELQQSRYGSDSTFKL